MPSLPSYGTALIPLRAQPLHTGHCNLLIDSSKHYESLVVLLSTKHGDESNPYSYQTREIRLQQAASHYSLPLIILPLPSFSSPMHISKSAAEVSMIREKFFALTGGKKFTLISGNPSVSRLCRDTYDFPVETIGEDRTPQWHLPLPNPFEKYESNGSSIRITLQRDGKTGAELLQAQGILPKWMNLSSLFAQDLTVSL